MSSSINGLELKTAKECGYQDTDLGGDAVIGILLVNGKPNWTIWKSKSDGMLIGNTSSLRRLPQLRPYRSDEVELGWCFVGKFTGTRYSVGHVGDMTVLLGTSAITFERLFADYKRCDAKGNILGPAGVEE